VYSFSAALCGQWRAKHPIARRIGQQIKREEVQGKLVRIKPALKIAELWNNI
jgi:hypothetical protein